MCDLAGVCAEVRGVVACRPGVTVVVAGLCRTGVEAATVCALLPEPPSTNMLAASPAAASSPTSAMILICGLTVRFIFSLTGLARQLTVQVPGVNRVPTEVPPPGPC